MRPLRIAAALSLSVTWALLSGCAIVPSPQRLEQYRQSASSGFTGCEAADNVISDVHAENGVISWHATCKARTYICADSTTLACAPVAQ